MFKLKKKKLLDWYFSIIFSNIFFGSVLKDCRVQHHKFLKEFKEALRQFSVKKKKIDRFEENFSGTKNIFPVEFF